MEAQIDHAAAQKVASKAVMLAPWDRTVWRALAYAGVVPWHEYDNCLFVIGFDTGIVMHRCPGRLAWCLTQVLYI